MNKLNADASRVGYKLTNNQPVQPVQQLLSTNNRLLSAFKYKEIQETSMILHKDYGFNKIRKTIRINGTNIIKDNYQGANYMNMDEAIARANSQLGGMYQQNMDKAIR